jgi:hypothetical protein
MALKELFIGVMTETLRRETKAKIVSGELKPPLNPALTAEAAWKGIISQPETADAVALMDITQSDIDAMVRKVYKELKCT